MKKEKDCECLNCLRKKNTHFHLLKKDEKKSSLQNNDTNNIKLKIAV